MFYMNNFNVLCNLVSKEEPKPKAKAAKGKKNKRQQKEEKIQKELQAMKKTKV